MSERTHAASRLNCLLIIFSSLVMCMSVIGLSIFTRSCSSSSSTETYPDTFRNLLGDFHEKPCHTIANHLSSIIKASKSPRNSFVLSPISYAFPSSNFQDSNTDHDPTPPPILLHHCSLSPSKVLHHGISRHEILGLGCSFQRIRSSEHLRSYAQIYQSPPLCPQQRRTPLLSNRHPRRGLRSRNIHGAANLRIWTCDPTLISYHCQRL